ncbi:MAG: hypothetical protein DMF61_09810 [Blastocatellia bacterium AA13]|nr:MAG: hypothetical protein DMF61_09810 [Blastocatellia bacterium AA13]
MRSDIRPQRSIDEAHEAAFFSGLKPDELARWKRALPKAHEAAFISGLRLIGVIRGLIRG